MQRLAELLEKRGRRQGQRAVRSRCRRSTRIRSASGRRTTSRRLAAECGGWAQLVEAYEAALPRVARAARTRRRCCRCCRRSRAPTRASSANPEAAIERNQAHPGDRAQRSRGGRRARAALHRHRALPRPARDLRQEARAGEVEDREAGDPLQAREPLRRRDQAAREGDRALPGDPHAGRRAAAGAGRARPHLHRPRPLERAGGDADQGDRSHRPTCGAIAELKFRRGACSTSTSPIAGAPSTSYNEALVARAGRTWARRPRCRRTSSRPALQMVAVEVLEPLYEQTEDTSRLVEVQRIRLNQEKNTGKRVALLLRIGALEAKLGNSEQAWDAYARAFTENPESTAAREALENLATILDNWASLVTPLRGRARRQEGSCRRRWSASSCWSSPSPTTRSSTSRRRRSSTSAARRRSSPRTRRRSWRSSASTRAPSAGRISIETLTKKFALVKEPCEREQIRMRIATVWEEMLNNVARGDQGLEGGPQGQRRATSRRCARSIACTCATGDFRELGDNIQRQLKLTKDPDETIALLGRLGDLREKQLGETGAAVETYRKILQIEPEHPDTLAALERILPNPEQELGVAQLLEPVYKARGDWPRLIARLRDRGAPRRRSRAEDRLLQADRRRLRGRPRRSRRTPTRRSAGRCARIRRTPRCRARSSGSRARSRSSRDLVGALQLAGVVGRPTRTSRTRSITRSRASTRSTWATDEQAADAYAAALDVSPRDIDAANALEQLYLRRGDYPNLVELLLRKADIVGAPDQKKALYYKAAQLYEEVLENVEKAIDVYRQVLTVDDSDPIALDHLERLYIRLSRWADLKDIYGKKAELAQNPQEKKQMLFVLGQVYDRELDDKARAIETYTSIVDLDPDDFDAAQALDRLYLQTERWYDLLAVLERQTELAPVGRPRWCRCASASASCGASTSRTSRAPSRPTARSWRWTRRTSRRCARSKASWPAGKRGAGAGGRGARADLRDRGRVGPRDRGLRGDAGEHRGGAAQGRAARSASPRSRSGGCRTRTRPSTPSGARSTPTRPTRTSSASWSGSPPRPGTGRSSPRSTPPSSRRSRTRAARSTRCCASRASTRRRPASSRRRSRPTGASCRASPTTKTRWSRSIASSARTSSGTSWPTSSAARSASRRTIRRSSS